MVKILRNRAAAELLLGGTRSCLNFVCGLITMCILKFYYYYFEVILPVVLNSNSGVLPRRGLMIFARAFNK